jgi:uncharacterized protein YjiS (DUF1127 family)
MNAIVTLIDTAMPRARFTLPLGEWMQVSRERRALARLSDRELLDIGIDPQRARTEAARPFWDLPRR